MREFIAKYGLIVAIVLIAGAAVCAYFSMHRGTPRVQAAKMFYVDEATGEELERLASENPPLLNKDGKPTLVRAVKISSDGGNTMTTAYLEKYTDDAKRIMDDKDNPLRMTVAYNGLLVRLPESGSPWVLENSPQGEAVLQRANVEGAVTVLPRAK